MKHSTLMTRSAIVAVLGAGLLVSACNQSTSAQQAPPPAAALPLTTASAPPIIDAPSGSQLPPAPPARLSRLSNPGDNYAYLDQASSQAYGFGDAPPDYTFDYDGYRPWVWRSDDGYEQVVEPLAGGNRYYYYRPGSDYPFLIRGSDYTYGYDNGALVVVYDHSGRVLPWAQVGQRADLAGRYLARAQTLYNAAQQNQHEAVAAANWSARRAELATEQSQWSQQQSADPDWRAYHDQHMSDDQAHWYQERYRREAEASRSAQALNDVAAAALYWQAAQQAQSAGRAHGQNFGGGQGGPGLFGHQNPPAGPPAAQAVNQGAPGPHPAGDDQYRPGQPQTQAQGGEHPMTNAPGGPTQPRQATQAEAAGHMAPERQAEERQAPERQAQERPLQAGPPAHPAQAAPEREGVRPAEPTQHEAQDAPRDSFHHAAPNQLHPGPAAQRETPPHAAPPAEVHEAQEAQRDSVHHAEPKPPHPAAPAQREAPSHAAPPAEVHAKPPAEAKGAEAKPHVAPSHSDERHQPDHAPSGAR